MGRTYDCIVIGGGPAACAAATLVAAAGHATLLLQPEAGWRWPAGEPAPREARGMLRRLGLSDDAGRQPGSNPACLLLQNAAAKGVEVRPASECGRHAPAAVDTRSVPATADQSDPAADNPVGRVIVEASKPAAPDHAALWAYYRGARRELGTADEGALVVPTRQGKSWFWFAPLPQGLTSVGVVFPADGLAGRESPESLLEEALCDCPAVLERLIDAELASEFHVLPQAPRPAPQVAGDGCLLVDDLAVCSDTVGAAKVPGCGKSANPCALFLALKAGEMTADCICCALAAGDTSYDQLRKWQDRVFAT